MKSIEIKEGQRWLKNEDNSHFLIINSIKKDEIRYTHSSSGSRIPKEQAWVNNHDSFKKALNNNYTLYVPIKKYNRRKLNLKIINPNNLKQGGSSRG